MNIVQRIFFGAAGGPTFLAAAFVAAVALSASPAKSDPKSTTTSKIGPAVVHTATIGIDGMTCGGCSKAIQRTLARQDGVTKAILRFKDAQADVSFDPRVVTAQQLALVISKDDQYTASVLKGHSSGRAIIDVDGLTCASCAENVQTALAKLKGFKSVVVDLKGKRAVVHYDPKTLTPAHMVTAVTTAGYKAKLHAPMTAASLRDQG